jgi:DNA-binding NarL/FixJ family response regulator
MNTTETALATPDRVGPSRLPTTRWSLLHVESCPAWAHLVTTVCAVWPDIEHLGVSTSLHDAGTRLAQEKPTIVLLALSLPDGSGLVLAEQIRCDTPDTKVIVCTRRDDPVALHAFDQLRLHGLMCKAHGESSLRDAVTRVLVGGRFMSPNLEAQHRAFRASPDAYPKRLTPKQQRLLPYFAKGLGNEQIAQARAMGVHAVRSHRYRIMANLGVTSTVDLIRWTRETGF